MTVLAKCPLLYSPIPPFIHSSILPLCNPAFSPFPDLTRPSYPSRASSSCSTPSLAALLPDLLASLQESLADRYRIERELGRGGMATVYLAHDIKHDRNVALKVLRPELAAVVGADRFKREINLAARLQHPHILSVHDSGEAAGQLWFTMPFVEGESLRDRLNREGQLPLRDAVRIGREVALALDYAHQHGVIHRDIKPENILLAQDGSSLVADFGIALALGGNQDRLTETGLAVGTAGYMSPEQATGERNLDARTDIYALGCAVYEMLAGEPPFTGPTARAIVARVMTETPRPIHATRPAVPLGVDEAVAKAMQRAPVDRYGSAAKFATALEAASSPTGQTTVVGTSAARVSASSWTARRALALATAAFVLGLGVLFAWRYRHPTKEAPGLRTIAVLPFENMGDSADAYFAEGVTDAVRGKLSLLSGLQVIASGSAGQYRHTTKAPEQVGQELGVQYLLVGKVRWAKAADGSSRVEVSPELVQVANVAAPTTKWQRPFDAALTDVFQVQADIAGRVAQALDVVLSDSVRKQLAERPTQNLAAYDAFLKAEAVTHSLNDFDPAVSRTSVDYYEQAVALDSTFALAWAQLSRARASLYYNISPLPDLGEASWRAAKRAVLIAPERPEGQLALGDYYLNVRADFPAAARAYEAGLRIAPDNADLLVGSALANQSLGDWEAARTDLERALAIDPRSVAAARRLAFTLMGLKRYPEALVAVDRSLALLPTSVDGIENKMMIYLAQGDLTRAQAVLNTASREVAPTTLAVSYATIWDLYWVLSDNQQQLVARSSSSASVFGANLPLALAGISSMHGDRRRTRSYADSARAGFEQNLRSTPDDAQGHALLGVALAYLGRKAEAIKEGERAVALTPISKDWYSGPYIQHQLVRIYILTGEPEKALDQLEPLLKAPYFLSPGWLKIDPNFDPLRKNPRFQRLVGGA